MAVNKIDGDAGLVPESVACPTRTSRRASSSQQSPTEGTRVDKQTVVRIDVSSGKPEVTIPSVVGQTVEDAVAELTRAGLDAQVVGGRTPTGTRAP